MRTSPLPHPNLQLRKYLTMSRFFSPIPWLLALAAAVPAQPPQIIPIGEDNNGNDAYITTSIREWPPAVPRVVPVRHCIPARLTGHMIPDVVVLDGQAPVLLTAPDVHRSIHPIGVTGPIHDIAVMSGVGTSPAVDHLLMGHDGGLRVWSRDPFSASIHIDDIDVPELAVGVRQLATHPLDPSIVFVVMPDTTTIRILDVANGDYTLSPVTISLGTEQILATMAVLWDADALAEVAVVTTAGLRVFHRGGGDPLDSWGGGVAASAYPNPRRCLAVAGRIEGGARREGLAWLVPKSGSGFWLKVRRDELSPAPDDIDLGTIAYAAITSADWSLDNEDEVLLSYQSGQTVDLLLGFSGLHDQTFHPGIGFRIKVHGGSQGIAPVATGDLDADGDADLLAVGDGGSVPSVVLIRSLPIDWSILINAVTGGRRNLQDGSELTVTWSAPPVPESFIGQEFYAEAILWAIEGPTSAETLVPVPKARCVAPIVNGQVEMQFTLPNTHGEFGAILRAVRLEGTGPEGKVIATGKGLRGRVVNAHGGGGSIPGVIPLPILPPAPPAPPSVIPAGGN